MHLTPLPLELDIECPIALPWHSSNPPTASPDDETQQLYEYIQRRYWETLYLPEVRPPSPVEAY